MGTIRRLSVCRFKGEATSALDFSAGVNLCVGGVGSGKTRLFDALWVLAMVARGAEAPIARYGWWSSNLPTEIEIEVDCAQVGPVAYSVQVRQDGLFSVVVEERLEHAGQLVLQRSGGRFRQMDGGDFEISKSRFAFASVVPRPMGDPIGALQHFLRNIWLLSPNPSAMVGGVQADVPPIDIECRYLARHIVSRQREQPQVYGLLMVYLRGFGVDPMDLSVLKDNFGQSYLAVRRMQDGRGSGMPFDSLSSAEKLLVLAAFVRTVNELTGPICCIWDGPLNGLGDREGVAVLQNLSQSFEARGQVILLSQYRSAMEVIGNVNRIEVRT